MFGELVGATDHHAVQSGWVLGDIDHDGPHFEHSCIVGFQSSLSAVQSLRLCNVAFDHRSVKKSQLE